MKKFILLATILLIAGTVSAQTYFNGARSDYNFDYQSSFSFEIGANISNSTSGANFNTGNLTGISAGFTADLPVAYPLSIVPGLMYTQKGYTANTPNGDFTQRSHSIDIPVMAKLRTGSVFNFFVGPQISYIVSNTTKFSDNFSAAHENYLYTGSNLRYQGVAGVGIDITKSVNVHARYIFDLQSTNANGQIYVPSYRLTAWQLGFGINI